MLPAFVPDVLARLPQWVYWQSEITVDGKRTKVPYQVSNWKRLAASTRPEEWDTFEDARTNYNLSNRTGVGFVFQQGGGIFGIDVDDINKVDPEHQEASLRLRALIHEHFPTYCEVSPSGTGRHYIGFGALPEDVQAIKDSKYGIEIYDKERFFTFTGEVLAERNELLNCQDALNDLVHTMRQANVASRAVASDEQDPRSVEQIIADIRAWRNGGEFSFIMDNPLPTVLSRHKNDHSSADMALANFIATATKDADKAVEIFRRSCLYRAEGKGGYKPESKYIEDYLIKMCFGKVWGENIVKDRQRAEAAAEGKAVASALVASERAKEQNKGADFAKMYGISLPMLDATRRDVPFPPGIAGDFIKAIHDGCYNPLPEFAVAVGMAFLSGVTGRAYRFQNHGLNSFFIVAAKSGTGKTQSINSLQGLLSRLDNPMIADRLYAVSGKTVQGLQTYFEKAPAGAWITDECGAQVRALTDPSNQNDHELKDAINALFDAAGPGKKWRPPASVRSQKEDKSITSLSCGIGWFTTREKVYSALGDDEVADGFLSRFVPIFYEGTMGDDNFDPIDKFPPNVARTLNTLWSIVSDNDVHMPVDGVGNQSKMVKVGIRDEAQQALRYFGTEARNVTRRAQDENDPLPDAFIAMSRVAVTAQRLAATCAVMDNPVQPTVTLEHVEWAIQLVGSRMMHVLELMSTGEVGGGNNKEFEVVRIVMKRELAKNPNGVKRSPLTTALRQRLPFSKPRFGTSYDAAARAVDAMVREGLLVQEAVDTGGRTANMYLPTNDPFWKF
jgi:hypothetical protein